jgi:hypothetical protein
MRRTCPRSGRSTGSTYREDQVEPALESTLADLHLLSSPVVGEQVATTLVFASSAVVLANKQLFLTRSRFWWFAEIPRYIARTSDAYDRARAMNQVQL